LRRFLFLPMFSAVSKPVFNIKLLFATFGLVNFL
jgi:hypothetical protein